MKIEISDDTLSLTIEEGDNIEEINFRSLVSSSAKFNGGYNLVIKKGNMIYKGECIFLLKDTLEYLFKQKKTKENECKKESEKLSEFIDKHMDFFYYKKHDKWRLRSQKGSEEKNKGKWIRQPQAFSCQPKPARKLG